MAFIDFSNQTMVSLSDELLSDPQTHQALESHPEMSGPYRSVARVHKVIMSQQQRAGANEERIGELTDLLTQTDTLHDRKARGLSSAIMALVDLSDDRDRADRWKALHGRLFPDGLAINKSSYLDEAGNARLVEARLTEADRQALESVEFDGKPLIEHFKAWIESGKALDGAYSERARLINADSDATAVTAGDVLKARHSWIRTLNAFFAMLEIADVDDELRRKLHSPFIQAEKDAQAAKARRAEDEDEQGEGELDDAPAEPVDEDGAQEEEDAQEEDDAHEQDVQADDGEVVY